MIEGQTDNQEFMRSTLSRAATKSLLTGWVVAADR